MGAPVYLKRELVIAFFFCSSLTNSSTSVSAVRKNRLLKTIICKGILCSHKIKQKHVTSEGPSLILIHFNLFAAKSNDLFFVHEPVFSEVR